ncbi:LuxR C-terminal-related transcriptional regulator, partial [Pyxidicoccus sp. 3LG]
PLALLAALARLSGARALEAPVPDVWRREGQGLDLSVTYVPLPPDTMGRRHWALVMRETSHAMPLPDAWRESLTPREAEVVAGVLRGWDNQLIADDLKCSLGTVKKHLQHVFDKLGVSSRAALLHHASRKR